MGTKRQKIFIGVLLLVAVSCQSTPAAPPAAGPTADIALTWTSFLETQTAQADSPTLNTSPTPQTILSTEALPTVTETAPLFVIEVVETAAPVAVTTMPQPAGDAHPTTVVSTVPPAPPTVQQFATLEGHVVVLYSDGYEDNNVKDIEVTVTIGSTKLIGRTNPLGNYSIANVPATTVIITFRYSLYAPQTLTGVIALPGQVVPVPPFKLKTFIPHDTSTTCSVVRPCTFPTLVNDLPAQP